MTKSGWQSEGLVRVNHLLNGRMELLRGDKYERYNKEGEQRIMLCVEEIYRNGEFGLMAQDFIVDVKLEDATIE